MTEPQYIWIKASDALAQLTHVHGSPPMVKAWLADALRDGSIVAHASRTWVAQTSKISFNIPDEPGDLEKDLLVPARYWRESKAWPDDQQIWRWPMNQALVTIRRKPLKRRYFRGLKFLQADVDRLAKVPRATPRGESRGPKTAAARWGFVAAKLHGLIETGELAGSQQPSVNSLAEKLQLLTNDVFGSTSLGEFSKAFLEHHKRGNTED